MKTNSIESGKRKRPSFWTVLQPKSLRSFYHTSYFFVFLISELSPWAADDAPLNQPGPTEQLVKLCTAKSGKQPMRGQLQQKKRHGEVYFICVCPCALWRKRSRYYTLIVLKMLKPVSAVLMTRPGTCGCQCSSLISFWPWWLKKTWLTTINTSSPYQGSKKTRREQMKQWSTRH